MNPRMVTDFDLPARIQDGGLGGDPAYNPSPKIPK
jgi:hypothetical protein